MEDEELQSSYAAQYSLRRSGKTSPSPSRHYTSSQRPPLPPKFTQSDGKRNFRGMTRNRECNLSTRSQERPKARKQGIPIENRFRKRQEPHSNHKQVVFTNDETLPTQNTPIRHSFAPILPDSSPKAPRNLSMSQSWNEKSEVEPLGSKSNTSFRSNHAENSTKSVMHIQSQVKTNAVQSKKMPSKSVAFGTTFKKDSRENLISVPGKQQPSSLPRTYVTEIVALAQQQRLAREKNLREVRGNEEVRAQNQLMGMQNNRTRHAPNVANPDGTIGRNPLTPSCDRSRLQCTPKKSSREYPVDTEPAPRHHTPLPTAPSTTLSSKKLQSRKFRHPKEDTVDSLLQQIETLEVTNSKLAHRLREFQDTNVQNASSARDRIQNLEGELLDLRQRVIVDQGHSEMDRNSSCFWLHQQQRADDYFSLLMSRQAIRTFGTQLQKRGRRFQLLRRHFSAWKRYSDVLKQGSWMQERSSYKLLAKVFQAWASSVIVSKLSARSVQKQNKEMKQRVFWAFRKALVASKKDTEECARRITLEWYSKAMRRSALLQQRHETFEKSKCTRLMRVVFWNWRLHCNKAATAHLTSWHSSRVESLKQRMERRRIHQCFRYWKEQCGFGLYKATLRQKVFVAWKAARVARRAVQKYVLMKLIMGQWKKVAKVAMVRWKEEVLKVRQRQHNLAALEKLNARLTSKLAGASLQSAWNHWNHVTISYSVGCKKGDELLKRRELGCKQELFKAWKEANHEAKTQNLISKSKLVDHLQQLLRDRSENEQFLKKTNHNLKFKIQTLETQLESSHQRLKERESISNFRLLNSSSKQDSESIAELQDLLEGAQRALVQSNASLENVTQERDGFAKQMEALCDENQDVLKKYQKQAIEVQEMKSAIAKFTILTNSAESKIREVASVVDEKNDRIKQLEKELANARLRIDSFEVDSQRKSYNRKIERPGWNSSIVHQQDFESQANFTDSLSSTCKKPMDPIELEEVPLDYVLQQSFVDIHHFNDRIWKLKEHIKQEDDKYNIQTLNT